MAIDIRRSVEAISTVLQHGVSYGAPTELEVELAELIVELIPSVDMVRMVNSGTEATMSAIRLARGYTGRDLIIKFDGLLPRSRRCTFGGGRFWCGHA